jgi:hypothetical protein
MRHDYRLGWILGIEKGSLFVVSKVDGVLELLRKLGNLLIGIATRSDFISSSPGLAVILAQVVERIVARPVGAKSFSAVLATRRVFTSPPAVVAISPVLPAVQAVFATTKGGEATLRAVLATVVRRLAIFSLAIVVPGFRKRQLEVVLVVFVLIVSRSFDTSVAGCAKSREQKMSTKLHSQRQATALRYSFFCSFVSV